MRIAFFVNGMDEEHAHYTTTLLAHEAARRGHRVCYITPGDFVVGADDTLRVHARFVPPEAGRLRAVERFFKAVRTATRQTSLIDAVDLDVLMLRNDPASDAIDRPWAEGAGIQFGRRAVEAGVLVLNDPAALAQATSKLYFQSFPRSVRAETLISRDAGDIREFADQHGGKVVLKPLKGSGGQGVFLLNPKTQSNINQMIEAISRDGYVVAQRYVPGAEKGDIRLFLMNGFPLQVGGRYAAMRRVNAKNDIRSNIRAGGKARAARIGQRQLRLAERIRPKLLADGMFLVGIDIIGDTILEVNVFSPGNLHACCETAGVNFAATILQAIERKLEIAAELRGHFDNRALAVL